MGGGHRGRSPDASGSPRGDDAPATPEAQAARLRDKLYDLRLRLMITSAQASAWDAFHGKAWDLLSRGMLKAAPADTEANAAQAIAQRADAVQQAASQWRGLADATDRLYQALSDEQRQIADQELPAVLPVSTGTLRSP